MTYRGFTITQIFGGANPNYRLGYHPGIDLRFALGSHQPAFAAGRATFQRDLNDGYGNTGTITLDNGDTIFYAHLAANGILVPSGSRVANNQPTFVTGKSGWVEGVHAHVEYRLNGNKNTPVDITKKLGEEVKIGSQSNWRARFNRLHHQLVRNGDMSDAVFNSIVGQDAWAIVESWSDHPEANRLIEYQKVGETATKDRWDLQIYNLQDQLKAVRAALENEKNKEPQVVIKEVEKIVEKIKEVPVEVIVEPSWLVKVREFINNFLGRK